MRQNAFDLWPNQSFTKIRYFMATFCKKLTRAKDFDIEYFIHKSNKLPLFLATVITYELKIRFSAYFAQTNCMSDLL